MASRGGTIFFLLLACSALVKPTHMPGNLDIKYVAKKLMKKCENKGEKIVYKIGSGGYQMPKMMLENSIFSDSDLPMEDKNDDSSSSTIDSFLSVLKLAMKGTKKEPPGQNPMADSDKMTNKMWNCTYLQDMIRVMRNSSESSACYMKAFVAPLSWMALTMQGENNMDPGDYEELLENSKSALLEIPSPSMTFPPKVDKEKMKKMMRMLRGVHDGMSMAQRARVVRWAKEQIAQNDFNCTMMAPPESRSEDINSSVSMESCKPSLKWLHLEAMNMMGPYLAGLTPDDIDSSPKEKLCEYFLSASFNSTFSSVTAMYPSLRVKLLQRVQECFNGSSKFEDHVDKLGKLVCYYNSATNVTPDFSRKLLAQLDNCDNPGIKQLKRRLVMSVLSNFNTTQTLYELGKNIALLSPKELSELSGTDLIEVLKDLGPSIKWTKNQLRTIVRNHLGNKTCKEVSGEELEAFQLVAKGLPLCFLKHIKDRKILYNPEAQKNICNQMTKAQLMAMLQGLREEISPSELVQKLSDPLLKRISLSYLKKANITSLDQTEGKAWSKPQASYLVEQLWDRNLFRRIRQVLSGIPCELIDNISDSNTQEMAQGMAECQQWLSRMQAGCVARKLFATLEKERADYFKTITEEELEKIPAFLLLHLPPSKLKDLPDSVCPTFLKKMENTNLDSVPPRSPSRPALIQKALLCLTKGEDLTVLTTQNISKLGQLLCELSASQLRLMSPDVVESILLAMGSCAYIPKGHRADLKQLINQTFGYPFDWSAETMTALGPSHPFGDAKSTLPQNSWTMDVVYSMPRLSHDDLEQMVFNLTITSTTNTALGQRAYINSIGEVSDQSNGILSGDVLTVELIDELGMPYVNQAAAELDMIPKETFVGTVETLGAIPTYNADQLAVLSKKAIEAFGPVSQMTESEVMQLGCIIQGFSNSDVERLPFSLDWIEDIGHCGWNESQVAQVWKGVAKYNNLTAQQLDATEMVALNQFICGLNVSEIRQLNKEAFRDAVGSMADIRCSYMVARQLKSLAVSVFGPCSTWTKARVSELGNIIAGLNATELAAMDPSIMSFIRNTSIPLIPPGNFAALSLDQLQSLDPDSAGLVTSEQLAALSTDQRAALERAMTGTREQTLNTSPSGAPMLSIDGFSAFMMSLLLFLMGFLLL